MPKAIDWMYLNPRPRAKAIACKHIAVHSFAAHDVVEVEPELGSVLEANAMGRVKKEVRLQLGQPAIAFLCTSPEVNGQLRQAIPVPELQEQWTTTVIPSELCTICPHWSKR